VDKDYFSVPDVEIKKIRSMRTIVDGKIVHESAGIRAGSPGFVNARCQIGFAADSRSDNKAGAPCGSSS
jgi:hypothetical protein